MPDENKNIIKNEQTKGLKRNTIDKFYTKDTIVNQCIDIIKKNNNIENNHLIIEPSAGNGAFIKEIKKLSNNFKFYDIDPEHEEIIKQDFLELENPTSDNKIHIIGNPPFGRQSSMAIKFIKKSCEFAQTISFILPKSFKKDSLKKHFDKYFHLINEIDLADNSFLVNNEETDVPCIFQIWEKKEEAREELTILKPINFIFIKKEENPDIAFRRVGVNAGTITRDIVDSSIQSHYFIKFTNNKGLNDNIKKIKNITYEFNNTVGPKSISKQELISQFNPLLV